MADTTTNMLQPDPPVDWVIHSGDADAPLGLSTTVALGPDGDLATDSWAVLAGLFQAHRAVAVTAAGQVLADAGATADEIATVQAALNADAALGSTLDRLILAPFLQAAAAASQGGGGTGALDGLLSGFSAADDMIGLVAAQRAASVELPASLATGDEAEAALRAALARGLSGSVVQYVVDPATESLRIHVDDATRTGGATLPLAADMVGPALVFGSRLDDDLAGGDSFDLLAGGTGADHLAGGAGNDILAGGRGADLLEGGDGFDLIAYSGSDAAVQIDLSAATASGGDAAGDVFSGIEGVTGSAFGDALTGDAQTQILAGLGGDDLLIGGGGADLLDGGAGTDTVSYATAASAVRADLKVGRGLLGEADGDVLVSIETLVGSGFDDILQGNAAVNLLSGGDGDDVLRGRGGGDELDGGAGFDIVSYTDAAEGVTVDLAFRRGTRGDAAGDQLVGIEAVHGSEQGDVLYGSSAAEKLAGFGGADILCGRGGTDLLIGGAGADRFVFRATSDSAVGASDHVADFSAAAGDRLDLSAIDARPDLEGDQAFSFVGTGGYSGAGGEIRTAQASSALMVFVDVDGDGRTDMSLALDGVTSLSAADFIL